MKLEPIKTFSMGIRLSDSAQSDLLSTRGSILMLHERGEFQICGEKPKLIQCPYSPNLIGNSERLNGKVESKSLT